MTESSGRKLFAGLFCALLLLAGARTRVCAETPKAAPSPASSPVPTNQITIDKVEPATVARGETVTISGKIPEQIEGIVVQLKRTEWAQSSGSGGTDNAASNNGALIIKPQPVTVTIPQSAFSFVVPLDTPLGRYQVLVSFTQKNATLGPFTAPVTPDGMLHIIMREPVKINSVYPAVSYPDKEHFEFKVLGEGFSPVPEDNRLVVVGRGVVAACPREQTADDCVNVEVSDNGHELRFWNIPLQKYQGQMEVQVRVGDRYAEKPVGLTLARVGKKYPAGIAAAFLLALIGLIFWLLNRRRRALTGSRSQAILSAIFLDTQTNTYSLSKFQFYAWTGAALFGYIYLTVSKSWVQGDFSFADIPGNLPGIIFISATTSVLAAGISSNKGSKGAGEINPSLADFISSGGVITAERLQFFVWTSIGVCAFIFLTLSVEPGSIHQLPTVPENFLYLMGISSFGYLGGKMARKPGPIISQIEAEVGTLTLTIHGTNLSSDARFKIDDTDLPSTLLNDTQHPDGRPQVLATEDEPDFAKVLRLVLNTSDPATQKWLTGKHTFTLINPDGQKATVEFTPVKAQSPDSTQPPPDESGETNKPTPPAQQTQLDKPTPPGPAPGESSGQPEGQPSQPPSQPKAEDTVAAPGSPTITDVSPPSGPVKGGTSVIICGTDFAPSVAVSFGDAQALNVTVLSETALVAQSPPHAAGAVEVVVQNLGGSSARSAAGYTYEESSASDSAAEIGQGG